MSLPASLRHTPALDRWLRFNHNGSITVRTGKVEIGQGIKTALAMIAAEELDVDLARIVVETADTEESPNEFITAGSMSIEHSGAAIRVVCATARHILLERAAVDLQTPVDTLVIKDGVITSIETNEQTDYWSVGAEEFFEVDVTEQPSLKHPSTYRLVGHRVQRIDLQSKLIGEVAFVQDMQLADMLHARVIKPDVPGARLLGQPDQTACPVSITVVHDGSFLAVVAENQTQVDRAWTWYTEHCRWEAASIGKHEAEIESYLRSHASHSLPVVDGTPQDLPVPDPSNDPTHRASYFRPFQMHASVAPSAALAHFINGKLTVYSHTQSVEFLKLALAQVFGLREDMVHVVHAEGAGCYGHNGADDVALDAAICAMACTPRPVRLSWSRSDEHRYEPYAPAAVIDVQATLDADGGIKRWRAEVFSFTHNGRPRPMQEGTNLQSAWYLQEPHARPPVGPAMAREVGIHRNLTPIYDLPDAQLIKHFVPASPLRTSSLRSLGAFANVFSIESFMDELAHVSGIEPVAYRLRHLSDRRAANVLETLLRHAPELPQGCGRGVGFARYKNQQAYCAVLVDLRVADDAGITLVNATICADVGLAIDPDGVVNQLEGGFIQAASWTLKEAVHWDSDGVTSIDWETYPILRFSEVPPITTHLIDNRGEPSLGVGEASTGPTPAAIANAVFDACGVRVRRLPMTREQVRSAARG